MNRCFFAAKSRQLADAMIVRSCTQLGLISASFVAVGRRFLRRLDIVESRLRDAKIGLVVVAHNGEVPNRRHEATHLIVGKGARLVVCLLPPFHRSSSRANYFTVRATHTPTELPENSTRLIAILPVTLEAAAGGLAHPQSRVRTSYFGTF